MASKLETVEFSGRSPLESLSKGLRNGLGVVRSAAPVALQIGATN